MSRVDNSVLVMGKVVKGPFLKYTQAGKARVSYQIQIEPRSKDKGMVQLPFIKSVGNQAERDKDNIKTGDLVIVEGRIITRTERKRMYFVKKEDGEFNELQQIDFDDVDLPDYDDSEIFSSDVTRTVTEIMADDVFYFNKFVDLLDDVEQRKLFSEKLLKKVQDERENGTVSQRPIKSYNEDED